MKKKITLELTGYKMCGTSIINLWGGGQGSIRMDTVKFPSDKRPTRAMLAKKVNDGQFGCESIEYAEAILYAVYGGCYEEEVKAYEFTKDEIGMNNTGVSRSK